MAQKKERNFWQKMFADGTTDTVSSKRVTMFLAMVMLIGLAIASAFGYNCDTTYIYVFASLVGAQSGFSTIEKCAKSITQSKTDVAKAEYADKKYHKATDDEYSSDSDSESEEEMSEDTDE